MKMFRQGDVLVMKVKVSEVPAGLPEVEKDNGKTVLAYGEVTGHSHSLSRGKLFRRDPLTQFLELDKLDLLRHEEHAPIKIGKGSYEVRQQRQWSLAMIRRVAD